MNAEVDLLHMLVVDDDDVDRERVRRFLARSALSVQIMEATCGADALRLVRDHVFDCVVLDNHLGDASGADLMSQLRVQARQACPIIMITGAGSEALAVKAMHEGASDYLAKTQLSPDVLVRAVRRSMEHHRLRAELAAMHQQLAQRVEEQAATIRQRERDLRALIDNAPTVMGYWDRGQYCRFGNHTHGEWFGIAADQLQGRHLSEVLGRDLHGAIDTHIQAALAGHTQQFEQPFKIGADGALRYAQVQLRPDLADDGQVQGFYATMADVTPIKLAQARAEEFLRFSEAVIENSPIGIAVFTPEGTCMIANAAFSEACGESIQALRGQDFRQRGAWRACGLVGEALRTLSDGLPHRLDVALIKPNGAEVQLACALARVDRGGQAHLLLIMRDITEQRQAHAALVAARDAAESAARTKGAFLANMSHEIRTPMNAIIGLSRLALEDTLPQVAREYLDKVYTAAVALMGILDDVLDYSKIEAGHMHFERISFDIEELLQRVADLFQARVEQKALCLSIDLAPQVPRRLMGDPLRLSQVLSNLLGNAIKFTESGYVHIKVELMDTDAAGTDALLRWCVIDTGIGMAPELREQLFDAFVQGDSSITRRFGGTGLGLAICKRLVELMNGEIGVDSEPGQGSTFWFTTSLQQAPAAGPVVDGPDFSDKCVLVVDGQDLTRGSVVSLLRAWHATVLSADSAGEALASLAQSQREGHQFDALIVDGEAIWAQDTLAVMQLRQSLHSMGRAGGPAPVLLVMVNARERHSRVLDLHGWPTHAVMSKPILASRLAGALQDALRSSPRPGLLSRAADVPSSGTTDHARARSQALKDMAAPLMGAQVLLAEDNRLNQIVAEGFLRQLGMVVTVVDDGAKAVKLVQISPPGTFVAVLMDLHMPVLDGLEATRRIRALAQGADTPVIGMTAAVLPEDRVRCLDAGMVDHISKPVVPERLIHVLLKWTHPDGLPSGHAPLLDMAEPVELTDLDWEALRGRVHGNETVMKTLLRVFLDCEGDAVAVMADLLARGDLKAARLRAHDLKGSSANLGAMRIAQASAMLESALKSGDEVDTAMYHFSQVMTSSLEAIRRLLG